MEVTQKLRHPAFRSEIVHQERRGMASRPVWEGHLRLSLVACPVRLFKATGEGDAVHFHLLHRQTLNRVKQQYRDPEDGVVERRDMVKGYEVERDRYVVVEDEELKKLKVESTKVIDIERFVDRGEIDRLYWEEPYYLVPSGKPAQEPFAVIREAMSGEDKVALGRLVMSQRERVVAIETRGRGMLLTRLRSHDEVRDEDEFFDAIPDVTISPKMVEIAKQIIAQQHGSFDPAEFRDRYEEAVRELIEAKADGAKLVTRPQQPEESNVVDLMEALRRSLKAPKPQAREEAATKREEGNDKPAAKQTGKAPPAPRRGGKDASRTARRRAAG
jgi:DNA end-binding protein Ku